VFNPLKDLCDVERGAGGFEYVLGKINLRPTFFALSPRRRLLRWGIGDSKLADSVQLSAKNLLERGKERITHRWEAGIALCGGRRIGHIGHKTSVP
jgi:hypothetical protein